MRFCITSLLLCCVTNFASTMEIKNLTGVVGKNIQFQDPIKRFGFLSSKKDPPVIAKVSNQRIVIHDPNYKNRINWNDKSGLLTMINLQKNDSKIYIISSEDNNSTFLYNLQVNDFSPVKNMIGFWLWQHIKDNAYVYVSFAIIIIFISTILILKQKKNVTCSTHVRRRGSSNEVSQRGSERDEGGSTSIEMESLNPPPPDVTATG